MRKLLTTLFILAGIGQAHAVTSEFEQLRHRLLDGKPTTSILNLDKCKAGQPERKNGAHGPTHGLLIRDFTIVPKPNLGIGYSNDRVTVTPNGKPILEVTQYYILPDETAAVSINRLSLRNYRNLSAPAIYECHLGTGLRFAPGEGIIPAVNG
jgi:hypothetical protein